MNEGAYEVPRCKQLAAGELWGLPPDYARFNADTWALMAWGKTFFALFFFGGFGVMMGADEV